MAGERNYLRVPPDSTGKALTIKHQMKITYTGKDAGASWTTDTTYTLGTSGLRITVHDWYESTTSAGYLMCTLQEDDRDSNKVPTVGETITGTAVVASYEDIYSNQTAIVGGHPEHELAIDNVGAANIRFAEGAPQLDAFGKLRTSSPQILGEYAFTHSPLAEHFSSTILGNTSVSHNATYRALELSLGTYTTQGTDFGRTHYGLLSHTSNTYHHYTPGASQLYMSTVALGDDGSAEPDVIRTWGVNDAFDGLMFSLQGSTVGVIMRNSLGAGTENFIPQANWNGDKLDGTGASKMVLDVTKDNIYWIDYQWLGAGTVRFGVFYRGTRIVCHSMHHSNDLAYSYMRTGSLPVCQSMMATAPSNGTVTMRTYCTGVYTEARVDIPGQGSLFTTTLKQILSSPTADIYYYLGTLSPIWDNGQEAGNHNLYFPDRIQCMALDENGNGINGEVEIYYEGVITNPTWESVDSFNPYATVERDQAGAYLGGGAHAGIYYVKDGYFQDNIEDQHQSLTTGAFKNYSCNGGVITENITSITDATPPVVTFDSTQMQLREIGEQQIIVEGTGTALDGNAYYIKAESINSVSLYTDAALTSAVTSVGVQGAGGTMTGFRGQRIAFTVVWKPFTTSTTQTVRFKLDWKEVSQ